MGIFSSFLWLLAGGSYIAGKGIQNTWHDAAFASTSSTPVVSSYSRPQRFEYDHARQRYLTGLFVAGYIDKHWPYDVEYAKSVPGYYGDYKKNLEFCAYATDAGRVILSDESTRPLNINHAEKIEHIYGMKYFKEAIYHIAKYEGWVVDWSDRIVEHCLRHPNEPTWLELENEKGVEYKDYLDKHPRNYMKIDPELEPKLLALVDAALIGWKSDREELMSYAKELGRLRYVPDGSGETYIKGMLGLEPIERDIPMEERRWILASSIAEAKGYTSLISGYYVWSNVYGPYNFWDAKSKEVYNKELARRKKAHENPTKLNEWSNLVFDLVNGEEHIRAEKPGHYEELLQEFKNITGQDFARGEEYFDMFRRLAIEDGWYIPDANKPWFKNPAPPEEEYGCAELPTRYQ